jgi:hypothetical protein
MFGEPSHAGQDIEEVWFAWGPPDIDGESVVQRMPASTVWYRPPNLPQECRIVFDRPG